MFIPIFIAILMGLISPANHSSNCNSGTVHVQSDNPNSGGDGGPSNDGDEPGPGPGGPGGDAGQNPPPKP